MSSEIRLPEPLYTDIHIPLTSRCLIQDLTQAFDNSKTVIIGSIKYEPTATYIINIYIFNYTIIAEC